MLDNNTARVAAIRVIYKMLELTQGQLDPNDIVALGYYLGYLSREAEPMTMHAAIARSSGNKAKTEHAETVLIVQETGRLQFRWWTFDPHGTHPFIWENETGSASESGMPWTTGAMLAHFREQGLDPDAAIWTAV